MQDLRSPAIYRWGVVTLLFTDIEGSTRLLSRLGDGYADLLAAHQSLLRAAFGAHGGHEVNAQGDALFVAFGRAADAVAGAAEAQRALAAHPWPPDATLRVRMGLHTGEPTRTGADYVGLDVHHGHRLMSAGHGGQVLLSQTAAALTERHLPTGVSLRDLGQHHLKDLSHPERIFQLVIPGLDADFPPLRALGGRPHNLPAQPTPLVGRQNEVAAACDLLKRDDVRLLTLTGTGGTGKTRLSLQVAADLLAEHEDGAFFVPLAAITEAGLVASAIASALGVAEVAGRPVAATLQTYLGEKRMLLVLDNFEQVTGAAPLVADLLSACPRLRVLVTSRSTLNVRGEREFPVPPLALPARRPPPPFELMTQYAAVALFIERARAVKPDFAVTPENVPAIAEICDRLDGLPLAIELAAARVKLLPPEAMLARLENSLKLLTGGARDLPERHQTLRATIGWSYDLLAEGERALFRRLAVFAGGCTLEAAEAVCRAPDDPAPETLDGVASLMHNSLLWQHGSGAEPRFFLLETVREFGLGKLADCGEEAGLCGRHAAFFVALAEDAYPNLLGADLPRWIEPLERDQENLRAALAWLLGDDPATALRLAMMLARFWRVIGHDAELREWLARALDRGAEAPAEVRSVALREMGEVLQRLTEFEQGDDLLTESAALSRQAGDQKNLAWTLRKLSEGALWRGNHEQAWGCVEESLAIERARGDSAGLAAALGYAGGLARNTGDLETARARYEESVPLWRACRNMANYADSLTKLAGLAYMRGDRARARDLQDESLPILRRLRATNNLLLSLRFLPPGQIRVARPVVPVDVHHLLVVVLRVLRDGQADLLQVAQARDLPRLLPHLGEDGEQDGGENRDDGDDDEKLDQGEAASAEAPPKAPKRRSRQPGLGAQVNHGGSGASGVVHSRRPARCSRRQHKGC